MDIPRGNLCIATYLVGRDTANQLLSRYFSLAQVLYSLQDFLISFFQQPMRVWHDFSLVNKLLDFFKELTDTPSGLLIRFSVVVAPQSHLDAQGTQSNDEIL